MASTTSTYTILTGAKTVDGSIRSWAQHSLVPAAQILEEAQAWIFERLRVREMTSIEPISLAIGASTMAAPTGYLAPIKLELDGLDKIDFVREDNFPRFVDSDATLTIGTPNYWTVIGTTIYFDTQLDTAQLGRLWCYKQPAALSVSNPTNFLTDRFPTLLRRACLMFAYESRHRAADFQAETLLAEQAIMNANVQDDMAKHGQVL